MSSRQRLFRTTEEQVEPVEAHVKGNIPSWLNGSYLRNGPGVFDNKDFSVNNWCDGLGVIYKFEINKGQVLYSKRIIQSDAYKKFISTGKTVFTELGTKAHSDTNKSFFQKMVSSVIPELTDNVGVNIFQLGKSIYLATESCNMRVLELENLSTNKKVDLSQKVSVNRMCSHILKSHDGTAYTLGSSFASNFKCQVIKIPSNSDKTSSNNEWQNAQSICTIPNRLTKYTSFTHSFGLTDRFVVYIEQPLFINTMQLMTAHLKGRSMLDCMEWNSSEKTRFILIEKDSGKIIPTIYESSLPFFFLHTVNCYEQNDELIVDLIGHDSPEILQKSLNLQKLRSLNFDLKDQSSCRRFILPLNIEGLPEGQNCIKSDERVTATKEGNKIVITGFEITPPNYDFPSINNNYLGKKYKYFYATGLFGHGPYCGSIIKVNVDTSDIIAWNGNDDSNPGEAFFVPNPNSTSEDDGILIAGVTATRTGDNDYLLILDAKDLSEIARAEVNVHVPHLIHGIFLPFTTE